VAFGAASVMAQPALHVTAPGCAPASELAVVHGNLLVVGASVACTFDATTLAHTGTIPLPGAPSAAALVAEASGDDFLLARNGTVNLLDGATGAVLQTFTDPNPNTLDRFGDAIATSGSHVLVGDPYDNEVHVFDVTTGTRSPSPRSTSASTSPCWAATWWWRAGSSSRPKRDFAAMTSRPGRRSGSSPH
jgi:hypothetical protein